MYSLQLESLIKKFPVSVENASSKFKIARDWRKTNPRFLLAAILDKIECIDSKWSLPDDMRFIRCQPLICSWPPLPDFGKKVWNKCIQRDDVCVAINLGVDVNDLFENSSKPSYENHENCFCQEALSMCKPKFITSYNESFHEAAPPRNPDNYRLMFQMNEKWISWYRLWV